MVVVNVELSASMLAKDDNVDLTSSTKMQNPIHPHLVSLLFLGTGSERKISSS